MLPLDSSIVLKNCVMLLPRGWVNSDSLKVNSNGKKFYDFIMHYFHIGRLSLFSSDIPVKHVSSVMFIKENGDKESSAALRHVFHDELREKYKVPFDEFMVKFSFVTDYAATMTDISEASA